MGAKIAYEVDSGGHRTFDQHNQEIPTAESLEALATLTDEQVKQIIYNSEDSDAGKARVMLGSNYEVIHETRANRIKEGVLLPGERRLVERILSGGTDEDTSIVVGGGY